MPKTIRDILEELFWTAHEIGIQKNMPNEQIAVKSTTQAIKELLKKKIGGMRRDCAHNKKWQSTYPKDCENIGFNQALSEITQIIEEL